MTTGPLESDRLDVWPVLQTLQRRWLALLFAAAIGAALGVAVSLLVTRRYEAHVTLLVRQLRFSAGGESVINTAGYPALLASRAIAAAVVADLSLGRRFGETPERLLQRMRIDDLRTAAIIRIVCEFRDPETAAAIANNWAERSVAVNREINRSATEATRDLVRAQLDLAEKRLTQAQSALLNHRRTAQPEMASADADGLLKKRTEELGLLVDIENERARLTAAEAQLTQVPETVTGQRDRFLEGDLAKMGGRSDYPLGGPSVANPVRLLLQYEAARSRTTLRGLERQLNELKVRRVLSNEPSAVLGKLYDAQSIQKRLELELDVAGQTYKSLSERFEQAQLQIASMNAELQIVDKAVVPSRHVWPNRPLFAISGSALMAFVVGAWLVRSAYGRSSEAS